MMFVFSKRANASLTVVEVTIPSILFGKKGVSIRDANFCCHSNPSFDKRGGEIRGLGGRQRLFISNTLN